MPSPQTLDIEALLAPVPGDNSVGESLRYAGPYDAIQEARQEGDDKDPLEPSIKTADWPAVIKIATEALATKSKDLQIATWLVEALVKQEGFPGLRDGFWLLRGLQEQFWEPLYPEIEDGDMEARILVLEQLNRDLPHSIKQIPITQGENYSLLHWEESRAVDNLERRDKEQWQAKIDNGKITGEQFDKVVTITPRAYYETLLEDLSQSWEGCEQLDRLVDEKFGREAPSLLDIKKTIEDCRTLVEGIVKKKRELEPDPTPPQPERGFLGRLLGKREDSTPSEPRLRPASSTSPRDGVSRDLQDRADALRRLADVADFFRRTEPHSPVAYLVQRAVRWGEMPLDEWLREVISDERVLAHVRETLGLKEPDSSGDTSE